MSLSRYVAIVLTLLSTLAAPGLHGQATPSWTAPKPHDQQPPNPKRNLELLKGMSSGWSVTDGKLLWTDDAGGHWSNITPPHHPPTKLISASFIDEERGWALLASRSDETDSNGPNQQPEFELAATVDLGKTWNAHKVAIKNREQINPLGGEGYLFFLDAQHGWMDLGTETGVHGGLLLSTTDGGTTWAWKADPGAGGPIMFANDRVGWLLGTWDDALYVTHDGAASWQDIDLPPPPKGSTAGRPLFFSLPKFTDSKHASLDVEYTAPDAVRRVVFLTDDGGTTWNAAGEQNTKRPLSQTNGAGISRSSTTDAGPSAKQPISAALQAQLLEQLLPLRGSIWQ